MTYVVEPINSGSSIGSKVAWFEVDTWEHPVAHSPELEIGLQNHPNYAVIVARWVSKGCVQPIPKRSPLVIC